VIRHEGDATRCVVILPGVRYFSQAPLLWFSREAAQARGWSVLEVDERAPAGEDPFAWIRDQAERALGEADAELVVVIGKSLGSAAAPLVSGPAIWLTPLLTRPEIAAALGKASAAALAIGSPDDPTWGDGELPDNPSLEVMELPGLDHSLQVSGDPLASLDVLRDVTARVGAFLDRLAAA
jgi:hypothetical protein